MLSNQFKWGITVQTIRSAWKQLVQVLDDLGLLTVAGTLLMLVLVAVVAWLGFDAFPPRNSREASAWVQAGGILILLSGASILTLLQLNRLATLETRRQVEKARILLAVACTASEEGLSLIEHALKAGHSPRLRLDELRDARQYLNRAALLPLPREAVFAVMNARKALVSQIALTDMLDRTTDWPGDIRVTINAIRDQLAAAATQLNGLHLVL